MAASVEKCNKDIIVYDGLTYFVLELILLKNDAEVVFLKGNESFFDVLTVIFIGRCL